MKINSQSIFSLETYPKFLLSIESPLLSPSTKYSSSFNLYSLDSYDFVRKYLYPLVIFDSMVPL